jgi:hypothetical protein
VRFRLECDGIGDCRAAATASEVKCYTEYVIGDLEGLRPKSLKVEDNQKKDPSIRPLLPSYSAPCLIDKYRVHLDPSIDVWTAHTLTTLMFGCFKVAIHAAFVNSHGLGLRIPASPQRKSAWYKRFLCNSPDSYLTSWSKSFGISH